MKRTTRPIVGLLTVATAALAFVLPLLAIEPLEISVESTNVVLSWHSIGYESFLVQFRPTLNDSTPWASFSTNYPANGSPRSTFTVPGAAPLSSSSSQGNSSTNGSAPPMPMAAIASEYGPSEPVVTRADGTGSIVPLEIYPPGFDFSEFLIYDPTSSDWVDGSGYEPQTPTLNGTSALQASDSAQEGDPVNSMFYRVFLVPDFWYDYTQYVFAEGSEFMPIYLGVDAMMVVNSKLLVDGKDFPYQEFDLQPWNFGTQGNPDWQYTYGIWFHSDRLTNGTHTVQLVTTLQLAPTSLRVTTPHLTMTSPAFQTTLNNPIVFSQWNNLLVGTNHNFVAKTTVYPASWNIDVLDASGNTVTNATGTTFDGYISWTWDFHDNQGNLRDNVEVDPYFDPWITVTPLASRSVQAAQTSSGNRNLKGTPTPVAQTGLFATSTSLERSTILSARLAKLKQRTTSLNDTTSTERPAPLSSIDYPYKGGWIVACQDHFKYKPEAREAAIQKFLGMTGVPSTAGLPVAGILLKCGNTNEIDMSSDPVQNMIDRNASWDNLRSHLLHPLFRNLYLFAHGSGFDVAGDWEETDAYGIPTEAALDLNTYQTTNGPISTTACLTSGWCQRLKKPVSDNPHPYRFVFLDGCSTASGDWPYAFGMIPATNSLSYYRNDNERPSAFVGWNEVTYTSLNRNSTYAGFGDYQQNADYRTSWAFNWAQNPQTHGLDQALGFAQTQSQWLPAGQESRHLSIFGFNALGFNDYNQRHFAFPPE